LAAKRRQHRGDPVAQQHKQDVMDIAANALEAFQYTILTQRVLEKELAAFHHAEPPSHTDPPLFDLVPRGLLWRMSGLWNGHATLEIWLDKNALGAWYRPLCVIARRRGVGARSWLPCS